MNWGQRSAWTALILATGVFALGAPVPAPSDSDIRREVEQILEAHRRPSIPAGRQVIWESTLWTHDVWGIGGIGPITFCLDDQGMAWVRHLAPVAGLPLALQLEVLQEEGVTWRPGQLVVEYLGSSAAAMKGSRLERVIQAWAKVPPPRPGGSATGQDFAPGPDLYARFSVTRSPLPEGDYPEQGYPFRLAQVLASSLGSPAPSHTFKPRERPSRYFEHQLIEWIESLQKELEGQWLKANAIDDFRSAVPDAWVNRLGPEMLEAAFQNDRRVLVEALLRRGVSLIHPTRGGGLPFLEACAHLDHIRIRDLLTRGASATLPDKAGRTPLHAACTNTSHDVDVIRLLLNQGAKPNAQDNDGLSPLHLATYSKYGVPIAQLLLRNGACPHLKDRQERLPSDLAAANAQGELATWLRKAESSHAHCACTSLQLAPMDPAHY